MRRLLPIALTACQLGGAPYVAWNPDHGVRLGGEGSMGIPWFDAALGYEQRMGTTGHFDAVFDSRYLQIDPDLGPHFQEGSFDARSTVVRIGAGFWPPPEGATGMFVAGGGTTWMGTA